jgi:cytochrome c peroxidase
MDIFRSVAKIGLIMMAGVHARLMFASESWALSRACPDTGLYQDQDGYCRPVTPYTELNGANNGFWKLADKHLRLDPRRIDLGRLLFFDPILSSDQTMSCASCHDPKKAFAGERAGLRNSPGLINLAYSSKFFWDGRANSPDAQIQGPLLSELEMRNKSLDDVVARLNASATYRELFAGLRPKKKKDAAIEWRELSETLNSFQQSLIAFRAPYDRYVLGDEAALDESQKRGFHLFRSFLTRCSECHTPPLFTNGQILTVGAPGEAKSFKVPTLRQISLTAPYMHRGAFKTLDEVVEFYNDGGGRSRKGISGRDTHWHVRPIGLSLEERTDLAAFLVSLTDDTWKFENPSRVPSGLPVTQ